MSSDSSIHIPFPLNPKIFNTVLVSLTAEHLKKEKFSDLIALMKAGYDFSEAKNELKGKFGEQFLKICLLAYESEDHYRLALSLVKAEIDVTTSCQKTALSSLHIAMQLHKLDLFCAIYLHAEKSGKAEDLLTKKDNKGRLPLSLMKSYESIHALSPDASTGAHYTPEIGLALLPLAIQYGCPEEHLLPFIDTLSPTELAKANAKGYCPLYIACRARNETIACRLIEAGATDVVSPQGSCLSAAFEGQLWNVVDLLVPEATVESLLSRNSRNQHAIIDAIRMRREDIAVTMLDKIKEHHFDYQEIFKIAKDTLSRSVVEKLLPYFSADELFGAKKIGLSIVQMAANANDVKLAKQLMQKAHGRSLERPYFEFLFNFFRNCLESDIDVAFLTSFLACIPDNILNNRDIKLEANTHKPHMGLFCFNAACTLNNKELAKQLLSRGIFESITSVQTPTVLNAIHNATRRGWDDIVGTIITLLPNHFFTTPDSNDRTPLFLACQGGHEKIAQILLDKGIKDTFSEKNGSSLTQAIVHGLESVALRLVEMADKSLLTKSAALLEAIRLKKEALAHKILEKLGSEKLVCCSKEFVLALEHGLEKIVDLIIQRSTPIALQAATEGKTLLMICCEKKRQDVALKILARQIKDRATSCGSALTWAMEHGLEQLVDKLIEQNDAALLNGPDAEGKTALYVACELGREDLALRLIAKGAKDCCTRNGTSILSFAYEKKLTQVSAKLEALFSPSAYGGKNLAPQIISFVTHGRQDLAMKLVTSQKLENAEGLEKAVAFVLKKEGQSDLAKQLLQSIPPVTLLAVFGSLCQQKEAALCMELVRFAKEKNLPDVTGALTQAVTHGMEKLAHQILDSFDIQSAFTNDEPLFQALENDLPSIVQKLLDKGVKNNGPRARKILSEAFGRIDDKALLETILGRTPDEVINAESKPLIRACKNGLKELACTLLQRGATDCYNQHGTALFYAMKNEWYEVVELLLPSTDERIVNYQDSAGNTALSLALEMGNVELAKKIYEQDATPEGCDFGPVIYHAFKQRVADPFLSELCRGISSEIYFLAFMMALNDKDEVTAEALYFKNIFEKNRIKKEAALSKALSNKCDKIAEMLFASGVSVSGLTLRNACMRSYTPLVLKLISSMSSRELKEPASKEALEHLLTQNDGLEAIKALLKAGVPLSIEKLPKLQIAPENLPCIIEHLQEKLSGFPCILQDLDLGSFARLADLLYEKNPDILCSHQEKTGGKHPIIIALRLHDRKLLQRFVPFIKVEEFFKLLRTDFTEEDSPEFRDLLLTLFKENPLSRKHGVIVAQFPEAPKGVYLFQLTKMAKKYLTDDPAKCNSISHLLNNIQGNHHITATPQDAKKRKSFYDEVARGFKLVISQLEKLNNPLKWREFLTEVASAGSACGIRYEQVANEQFITHCLGMGASRPEDKIYNSMSRLRYTILQACAENHGLRQDVHIVRELIQELAEDLGIACHGVNRGVKDKYHSLPENVAARAEKVAQYKKKFCDAYTLESIINNILLYPDLQQEVTTYLNESPPHYWVNFEVEKALNLVQAMTKEEKSHDEIKKALRDLGHLYPSDWSLEKIVNQIRFDAWSQGYTDASGTDHSFLYVIKDLTSIGSGHVQSLRFVTVLEALYDLGVAESEFPLL